MRRAKSVLLALVLIGCSDDTTPQRDLAASDRPGSGDQVLAGDKATGGEQPAPAPEGPSPSLDKGGPAPDSGGAPKILTTSHPGWSKPGCDQCHNPLPLPKHTATKPPQCAQCHGGNGACNPNGPNSGKQNHTATLSCTSCHSGGKHGFSANADCVSCHFATAGTRDCPP